MPAEEKRGPHPHVTHTDLQAASVALAAAAPEEGSSPEEEREGLHPGACKKVRGGRQRGHPLSAPLPPPPGQGAEGPAGLGTSPQAPQARRGLS